MVGAKRPGGSKAGAAAQAGAQARRLRLAVWVSVGVVAAVAVLVLAKVTSGPKSSTSSSGASGPLPASVVADFAKVTPAQLAAAASSGRVPALTEISAPALTSAGKPEVLYVGAEYCPYCAAERWAVALALSKFGAFVGLRQTHSSSVDAYPDTVTLSFHNTTFTSDLVSFHGVETASNVVEGNRYKPLDSLTPEQEKLFGTYNAPPYVSASSSGAFPWVDVGGAAIGSGASYSPELLQGKTASQIAAGIADPRSDIGLHVQAAAGRYVAVLCGLTRNRPAAVCAPFATK